MTAFASAQPMSGVYPVGPGGPGVDSFATVQEAAAALSNRGLGGDVEFRIATGTYTGPVVVRSVANSGSFRTTFRSPQLPATIDAAGARYAFSVESTDNVMLHRLRFMGARDSGSAAVRFRDSRNLRLGSGRVVDSCEVGVHAVRCESLELDSVRVEVPLSGVGSRGVELRDCRFVDVYRCSMPGTVGTGMLVRGGSDVSVYRMTVMDPLLFGLRLEDTRDGTFWRCFSRGSPEYGIHAVGSNRMLFDSCTAAGPTEAGAFFDRCDSLRYLIPMLVTSAPRAFWLSRSEDCSVRVLSIMGQPTVSMFFDRSPRCAVESTQALGVQADTGFGLLVDSCPGSSFDFVQMAGSFRSGIVVRRSDDVRFRHVRTRGTVSEAALSIENSSRVAVQTCSLGTVAGVAGVAAVELSGDCADDTLMEMTVLAEAEYGILAQGGGVRRAVIANNFVTAWTGSGVLLDRADSTRLFYNTIVSPEQGGVSGVMFRDVSGCRSLDNIFWNRGLDSSACYRVEGAFPFAAGASDHNDLYSSGTSGNTALVNGTLYPRLGDWRVLGQDGRSIAQDPMFEESGDFHLSSGSACRDSGVPTPGILRDLDGDSRNPATPDIGADEFRPDAIAELCRERSSRMPLSVSNPVGRHAVVRFSLGDAAEVRIRVLDVSGRLVMTTEPQFRAAGRHETGLDLHGLSVGVYLVELSTGQLQATGKVVKTE